MMAVLPLSSIALPILFLWPAAEGGDSDIAGNPPAAKMVRLIVSRQFGVASAIDPYYRETYGYSCDAAEPVRRTGACAHGRGACFVLVAEFHVVTLSVPPLRFLPAHFPWVGRSPIVGHVDTIEDRHLHGWAWQPSAPDRRLLVDIFVDGAFYGQQLAHRLRPDLRAQGIGDGSYGFEIDLGDSSYSARSIDVFALGDRRTRVASRLPTGVEQVGPAVRTARDYIRTTFRALHGWNVGDDVRAGPAAANPLYERLFAPSPVPSDPVVLGARLCGYLDLVRLRSNLRDIDPSLTPARYGAFLRAYLESYGKIRGRQRAPLSAPDIAFLNAPEAHRDGSSRAQALWAGDCDLPSQDRAFLWAAFLAPRLSVEDCLIPPPDIAALSRIVEAGRFPLTHFMVALVERNPFLRALPRRTEDERAFVTFAFLLLASRNPHFLMFTDADAVDAFLSEENGESRFDAHWRAIFGGQAKLTPSETWRRMIAHSGFDIPRRRFHSIAPSGSRLAAPQIAVRNEACVDVQVFGPFSRALGVGQSARRLAVALRGLNYSIRLCDFSMDHANERNVRETAGLEHPGPARVNIFHMNLEDIPTLVAYSADVFTGRPAVAVPYLELSPVSASHYLGLDLVDEIWAATRFVADIVSPHRQAFVIGACVESLARHGRREARQVAYDNVVGAGDFVFLTAGDALSGVDRKNPLGAIRSFLMAFPVETGVRLVIKTHSTAKVISPYEQDVWSAIHDICAADPRIVLLDRLLPDDAHHALIEGADCLVSLHRSEGLGYYLLEAMKLGVPVIATAYSGPADFCSEDTAFPCDYRLVHVEPHQYARASAGQMWAEPDYAHAARQMQTVFHDRAAREKVVANACRLVDDDYSPEALSARLEMRLRDLFDRLG